MSIANSVSRQRFLWAAAVIAFVLTDRVVADEVLTPAHVAKLRSVISTKISPDGQHIAYVLSVPRRPFIDDNGPAWAELHVVDAQGHARAFITGEVNVSRIKWTPDGKRISFLLKRGDDEHKTLYAIPIDGGEAQELLEHDTDISEYDWHPHGKQVAFLAKEKQDKDDKELKEKGFDPKVYEEDLKFTRVWMTDVSTGAKSSEQTEEEKPRMLALDGSASSLHFNPTGDHLAVALAPTPLIDDHYMRREINIIDSVTGKPLAQLDTPGKIGPMAFSRDGQHLAVIAGADINDPSAGRLMVGSVEGGQMTDLLPGYLGNVMSVAWQNNDTVMYVVDEGTSTSFGRVRRDGTEPHAILPAGRHVLRGLTLTEDGQTAAFSSHSSSHPSEVFMMKHGQAGPKRLTNSNPWLADIRFAKQEVITYYARDGEQIEGLLIHPMDEKEGQRYPLVLIVHGGPESHYTNGWMTSYSRPGQIFAARGFAVFYPNYRGSTGRGVAFSKKGQSDYGGKEFDDLIDGIDHLIKAGLVDKDRVGVTGGSYGGFASAWCATYHSERFAASVMFVGISDQVSKFGTTDIPREMFLVHSRKWPWEDWSFFRERSPISYAEKCRTPILIMHGEEDTRVHPSQSMELYRYLKILDKVPVRLVFYPGEGHGNRKAAARLDYNLRLVRWMEHYLKGPGGDPPPFKMDYSDVRPTKEEADESKK